MATENFNAQSKQKRKISNYFESPSVVLRAVRYEDLSDETAVIRNVFKNPFIPFAVINYDQLNDPGNGITGPDPDAIQDFTEGNNAEKFGFNLATITQDKESLILFYATVKAMPVADLDYIMNTLAAHLPDEVWLSPRTVTVNDDALASAVIADKTVLLILEQR